MHIIHKVIKLFFIIFFLLSSWSLTTGISLFILHSIKIGAAALLLTLAKDKPGKNCITTVAYLFAVFLPCLADMIGIHHM